jgi:hypothetical protein
MTPRINPLSITRWILLAGVFFFLGVNFSPCRGLPVRAYAHSEGVRMVQGEVNEIVRLNDAGTDTKR